MTPVLVISGFLGSGKTTLIRYLSQTAFRSQRIVVIENDFGDVNLDGEYLKNTGLVVAEINAGCICCSLTATLHDVVQAVLTDVAPDRILIEPSGVARLSDLLQVLRETQERCPIVLEGVITLARPIRSGAYLRHFGGIYKNQLQNADLILPDCSGAQDATFLHFLRENAQGVPILDRQWIEMAPEALLSLIDHKQNPCLFPQRRAPHSHTPAPDSFVQHLPQSFSAAALREAVSDIAADPAQYGCLLRAKGFVVDSNGGAVKVDWTLTDFQTEAQPVLTDPKMVFIGFGLRREAIHALFAAKASAI
ncbi:MAG: GTP-binding protein [Candidatus Pelethousia sp.]|nr:GTP-binding protein [Candidatus Pelethousia sp.]